MLRDKLTTPASSEWIVSQEHYVLQAAALTLSAWQELRTFSGVAPE